MLGCEQDEGALFDIIVDMEPEDGLIWVHGSGDEAYPAFTHEGIDELEVRTAAYLVERDLVPPKS